MFGKLFSQKAKNKVESARKKANSALGMFAKADRKLTIANEKLLKIAEDARIEAEELTREAQRAEAERNANRLVQEKLKEFIPKIQ